MFRQLVPAARKPPMLAAAAMAALVLSACGGGGGGSATTGSTRGSPAPVPPVAYANLAPEAVKAATGAPVFGRQDSNWRATYDHLTTFMTSTGVASSFVQGTAPNFPPAEILTRTNAPGQIYPSISYPVATTSNHNVIFDNTADNYWRETRTQGTVDSLTKFRINATSNDSAESSDFDESGQVAHITVYTDYDVTADGNNDGTTGDDTDYMAVAVWDMGPHSEDHPWGTTRTAAGALAMGTVPFASGDFGSQTSVSYNGTAGGKRYSGGEVTDFETTVSLTANFSGTATISGTVADVGGGQKLKLLSATPDKTKDGGPFSGNTELFDENDMKVSGYAGKWGGAFFGVTTTTDDSGTPVKDPPAGTAGTFGVSGGNPSDSILGVFIADRD